jgi:hypothetical protein
MVGRSFLPRNFEIGGTSSVLVPLRQFGFLSLRQYKILVCENRPATGLSSPQADKKIFTRELRFASRKLVTGFGGEIGSIA